MSRDQNPTRHSEAEQSGSDAAQAGRHDREVAAVQAVAEIVARASDVGEIFHDVLELLTGLLAADAAAVFIRGERSDEAMPRYQVTTGEVQVPPKRWAQSHRRVIEEGEPIALADPRSRLPFVAGVPLRSRGQVSGALLVGRRVAPEYGQEDLAVLEREFNTYRQRGRIPDDDQIAARLAELEAKMEQLDRDLRERVETLERIVTDRKSHLKREFDYLDKAS